MGSSQATTEFRRRRKENLIQVMGGKCAICGYQKNHGALEFHHLIPEQKSYGIAAQGTCHNLQRDLEEVHKCILVCANCHREIHAGDYSLKELQHYQYYDDTFAEALLIENQKKQGLIKESFYCLKCGKEITKDSQSGLCGECVRKAKRVCERPSREELKNLIRTTPFTQIAKQYNVSDNAIRKWCDSYNLPRKSAVIKNYTNDEWQLV